MIIPKIKSPKAAIKYSTFNIAGKVVSTHSSPNLHIDPVDFSQEFIIPKIPANAKNTPTHCLVFIFFIFSTVSL